MRLKIDRGPYGSWANSKLKDGKMYGGGARGYRGGAIGGGVGRDPKGVVGDRTTHLSDRPSGKLPEESESSNDSHKKTKNRSQQGGLSSCCVFGWVLTYNY